MEVQFIDSESGKVIGMGKDTQAGSKLDMAAKVDEWGHAKSAFAYWAKSLKTGLDDITAGKFKTGEVDWERDTVSVDVEHSQM